MENKKSEINTRNKMQPIIENAVNTPAFLGKLWKMVNDPTTDHLICWSAAGNSFVIQNQAQFWYELLPLYYKHNNMSSFVRQLNMYGFHKMSTVENGTMDADKDEIQFTHPFFQKDQPELLRNIKRKATTSKSVETGHKHDELTKVLTDVKQLRGRQANVDSQLNAMKQENALLWREVAILRQKHLKQQKIVNKLIQFLVTLVQPSRMTVGVKRGYQLMLNESPNKKSKSDDINKNNHQLNNNAKGPTIHELDNEIDLAPNIYEEEPPLVNSPATSTTSQQTDLNSPIPSVLLIDGNGDQVADVWDKPEFVSISSINSRSSPEDLLLENELSDENLISTLENEVTPTLATSPPPSGTTSSKDKVFLNPSTQDTLLSNFVKRHVGLKNGKKSQIDSDNIQIKIEPVSSNVSSNTDMAIATRDNGFSDIIKSMPSTSDSYSEDLSAHVETTQTELEQLKDILNGYNSFVDANALLGELDKTPQKLNSADLFSDSPEYDIRITGDKDSDNLIVDPMVSGSELTPYGQNFDFDELLYDDEIDQQNTSTVPSSQQQSIVTSSSSTINTPQITTNEEPVFPAISVNKK